MATKGTVKVKVHLTAVSGDHGVFYGGQQYEVTKDAAEWLLDDPRVATPVRSSGKTETAVEE